MRLRGSRRILLVLGRSGPLLFLCSVLIPPLLAASSGATDWSSCQNDLDGVKRAASDASDAAERAQSAREDLEAKADELRSAGSSLRFCSGDCSYYRWHYQSARDDFESAKSDYDAAKSDAESELDTLASRVHAASSSCAFALGAAASRPTGDPEDRLCALIRRYK